MWSALCNVGGEWCWEWNMEQIVGVWRGRFKGGLWRRSRSFLNKGTRRRSSTQGGCQRGCSSSQEGGTGATEARRRGRATVWESPKQPEGGQRRGSCR